MSELGDRILKEASDRATIARNHAEVIARLSRIERKVDFVGKFTAVFVGLALGACVFGALIGSLGSFVATVAAIIVFSVATTLLQRAVN